MLNFLYPHILLIDVKSSCLIQRKVFNIFNAIIADCKMSECAEQWADMSPAILSRHLDNQNCPNIPLVSSQSCTITPAVSSSFPLSHQISITNIWFILPLSQHIVLYSLIKICLTLWIQTSACCLMSVTIRIDTLKIMKLGLAWSENI